MTNTKKWREDGCVLLFKPKEELSQNGVTALKFDMAVAFIKNINELPPPQINDY